MKNIAFTICSNNYLAQAKVLSDSVYKYSRDYYDFYIVLCDEYSERIDYSEFHASFVLAKDLKIDNFDWMTRYYNIIELNTAIKPFAFKYLIEEHSPKYIYYLDPDTCTYSPLSVLEEELGGDSILLTPHSLAPLPFDGKIPTDNIFLNHGIYNLGFLGLRVSDDSLGMLNWWGEFLRTHCLDRVEKGFFVDQLPMELVPIYFHDATKVSFHRGINTAYWNLHERSVCYDENSAHFIIDEKTPLVMYHFSSYNIDNENVISRYDGRNSFDGNDGLKKLFDDYSKNYKATKYLLYKSVNCVYMERHNVWWRVLFREYSNKLVSLARMLAEYVARL